MARKHGHNCPAWGCTVTVQPKFLACREHWFMLPKPLRDRIKAAARAKNRRGAGVGEIDEYWAAVGEARSVWKQLLAPEEHAAQE